MQVWPLFCVLFGLRSLSFSNSQQNILLYLKVLLRQFPFRIKMSVPFLAVDAISKNILREASHIDFAHKKRQFYGVFYLLFSFLNI